DSRAGTGGCPRTLRPRDQWRHAITCRPPRHRRVTWLSSTRGTARIAARRGRGFRQPFCPGFSPAPHPTLPHKGGGLLFLPPPSCGWLLFLPPRSWGGLLSLPPRSWGGLLFLPPRSWGGLLFLPPRSWGGLLFLPPRSWGGLVLLPSRSWGGLLFLP